MADIKRRHDLIRFYMACGILIIAGLGANAVLLLWASGAFR